MQAVIMAGGKGTRLLELTRDQIPKPMAPILGKPLLERQMEALKSNGIADIILITGHLGDKIEECFGDGSRLGLRIRYLREESPLGTAGALAELPPLLEGPDFLLVLGDVLFDVSLSRMRRFHASRDALATLFVHPNSHPQDSDLVVCEPQTGRILQFDGKGNRRDAWYDNCVNAGLYLMKTSLCRGMEAGRKTDLEREVLVPLIKTGRVFGYRSPEYVKDVGTVERIRRAEAELAGGLVAARSLERPQRCVFLDRDGTINRYRGLLSKEEDFELEEGAADAIKRMNESGYLAIVATNQPVVARGLCSVEDVTVIHNKMKTLLGREGAWLDDVRFCPHHPDGGYPEENPLYKTPCSCRKPQTGMIDDCAALYHIERGRSWFVGDTTVDIQTGINAGLNTILLRTGLAGADRKYAARPRLHCDNLPDAVEAILKEGSVKEN